MTAYLYIAAGGALGSLGRYWMAGAIDGRFNAAFPYGTLAVNILGDRLSDALDPRKSRRGSL